MLALVEKKNLQPREVSQKLPQTLKTHAKKLVACNGPKGFRINFFRLLIFRVILFNLSWLQNDAKNVKTRKKPESFSQVTSSNPKLSAVS